MSDEEQEHQAEADSTSSSSTEFSECEMSPQQQAFKDVADEEEQEQQADTDRFAEKDVAPGQSPSKMDPNAHGSNLQLSDVKVKISSNTAHQRIYDKKNFCLYCEKPFVKLTRHLKQMHSDRPDVAKALAHRQGSAMRDQLLTKIRNMGNYHHNCSVLSSGKGQIIPKRLATHKSTATDYLPCRFCCAMYSKSDLWRHHKRCKLRTEKDQPNRRIQDTTETDDGCFQAPTQMEISESTGSDLMNSSTGSDLMNPSTGSDLMNPSTGSDLMNPSTGSDLMNPSTSTEDGLSGCEIDTEQQASLSLDMSDEGQEHQAEADSTSSSTEFSECEMSPQQQAFMDLTDDEEEQEQQADTDRFAEKDVAPGQSPSKMDPNAHGSNLQLSDVKVKISSNTAHQRMYDKKNFCLYCEKPFVKLTRHLKQMHFNRPDVAKALAHRQGSAMRDQLLAKIRNMGNYHHNCSVLSSGKGQIIPKRLATHKSTATDYLPCRFCCAMYSKSDLWRHHKRCKLRTEKDQPNRRIQASCSLMLPLDTTISHGLKQIIEEMTNDAVTHLVKSDMLIISLGERMFPKNGEVGRQRADIRNKMRQVARLVLMARTIDGSIVHLRDLINPTKFNTVIEAVKKMTGFDENTNRFSTPSTALKLRHSLVKITHILQGEALRQNDDALKQRAEQFHKLIEMEWTMHVSANALKTLYKKKWNSPQMLPQDEDIRKLYSHLKCLEEVHKTSLTKDPSRGSWSELSQVTLTQLILFNRRREGEVSGMEIATFLQRNQTSMQDEIKKSLTPFEKKLIENLVRIEVRGEKGRKVSVMFPTNVRESIELLIKTRDKVGISLSNIYIFARPYHGSQDHIRGCDCLRRFALSCGAAHPQNLTSTKLRKHVATLSQILNLQTNELDQLATFMGHDIEVHGEYYSLPEETLRMAKVSRILFALQGGIAKFKGKSLEDIIPNLSSGEESSDEDEAAHIQSEQTAPASQEGNSEDEHSSGTAATSRKALGNIKKSACPSTQKEKRCKDRWRSLRDTSVKEPKKEKERKASGAPAPTKPPWKSIKVMGFLDPFIEGRETSSNLPKRSMGSSSSTTAAEPPLATEPPSPTPSSANSYAELYFDDEEEQLDEDDEDEEGSSGSRGSATPTTPAPATASTSTTAPSLQPPQPQRWGRKKRGASTFSPFERSVLQAPPAPPVPPPTPPPQTGLSHTDEDEVFFVSLLPTLRRLPLRKKAEVKFKIHQLLFEAEQGERVDE